MRKVYSQVLHRVDKAYQAFFRRGHGFPRFKGKGWYDSFTYPQLGFRLEGTRLSVSKIGNLKVKLHRPLQGEVKTLTLKHEHGKWYACFSCMVDAEWLPATEAAVGIDVGLNSFAVTSAGEIQEKFGTTRDGSAASKGNCGASRGTFPAAARVPAVGAGLAATSPDCIGMC